MVTDKTDTAPQSVRTEFAYTIQDLERLTGFNRWVLRRMLINRGVIPPQSGNKGGCRIFVLTRELRRKWPEFFAAVRDREFLAAWDSGIVPQPAPASRKPVQLNFFAWTMRDLVDIAGCSRHRLRRLLINQGLLAPENKGKKIRIFKTDMARKCPELFWALERRKETEQACQEWPMM